jgi:cytochrome c oxidase subunit 4
MRNHVLRDHDAAAHAGHFNEADPHGAGATQSHHHVVSLTTLRIVLGLLLVFTVLTVGAAQFEVWLQGYINYELPRWVNVAIAMSIATVKAALVVLFFMQLKHDNPINGIIFVLCILGVGLFLGFTALDLFTRDRVYAEKAKVILNGGTGNTLSRSAGVDADGKPKTESISGPIVEYVRNQKILQVGPAEYERLKAEAHAGHGHHGHADAGLSTAKKSIVRTGRTDALSTAAPAHANEHAPAGHAADGAKPAGEAGGHPAPADHK